MLFYASTEELNRIPSSYMTMMVSNKLNVDHEGMTSLKVLMPQMKDYSYLFMVDDKKNYIIEVTKDSRKMPYIVSMMMQLSRGAHIVLVYDKREKEKVGFNYCKALCKYIEKTFGYPGYKFTNDITLDMKRDSKMSEEGYLEYMDLLNKFSGVLSGDRVE